MERAKKYWLVLPILLLIALAVGYFSFHRQDKQEIEKTIHPPSETQEIIFSEEDLEKYYSVYQNPYVIHIRKALNGYLDGSNEGMDMPELVIKAHTIYDAPAGLASFSRGYYESKFVVLAINDSPMGGRIIDIIFQDKPDKVFSAWVYQLADGTYDFRGFWQNMDFTDEVLKETLEMYKTIIEDKEHSL